MMVKFFQLLFAIIIFVPSYVAANPLGDLEQGYQGDADKARLEHLLFWTEIIEAYHAKMGFYPLQDIVADKPMQVRIATAQQRSFLMKGGKDYVPALDNNADGAFEEIPLNIFLAEIEKRLGGDIEEKYDVQKVPTKSPVGYHYFATKEGYLMWVTCITCGVTDVSTLLMDGYTPTVNIVSPGMKGAVTKALTRDEMIANKTFQSWQALPYKQEFYVRKIEIENSKDSEKE